MASETGLAIHPGMDPAPEHENSPSHPTFYCIVSTYQDILPCVSGSDHPISSESFKISDRFMHEEGDWVSADSHAVAAGSALPTLPPSVEEAYKKKCIQLKRRMNEVEESNDAFRLRKVRLMRGIRKMRLERAFLLEILGKRMKKNGSGPNGVHGFYDEESEGSSEGPPTVCYSRSKAPSCALYVLENNSIHHSLSRNLYGPKEVTAALFHPPRHLSSTSPIKTPRLATQSALSQISNLRTFLPPMARQPCVSPTRTHPPSPFHRLPTTTTPPITPTVIILTPRIPGRR